MRVLVVTAIYPTPERPNFGTFIGTQVESLRAAGVEVEVLFLDAPSRKVAYAKGVPQLREAIKRFRPDLVHAHHGYVGFVAATRPRGVPAVLTYHGSDLLGAPGEDGSVSPLRQVDARLNAQIARRYDEIIVQTRQMSARLPHRTTHVIPCEIDFEVFHPIDRDAARAELGLDPARPLALFAAPATSRVKNFPMAKEAIERVRRTIPEAELLHVHKETQPRLALYLNAVDVLVFPSFQEGSPNLVKQAMACNLPIVATDVGDVRDVIEGVDGCHVVATDPGVFAEHLVAELERRRRTDGAPAVAGYTRERVAATVMAVYERALGRADPATATGSLDLVPR